MNPALELDHDPARTLSEVAQQHGSGVLSCVRGKQRRIVCLQDGALVHVASNAIEEQVDAYLVRSRLLPAHERKAWLEESARLGRSVAALLAERPGIDRSALEATVSARNRDLFLAALDAADAEYRFERGTPNLAAELVVPQACLPLVFAHALRPVRPLDVVRVRIGPPGFRPTRSPDAEQRLVGIELTAAAQAILAQADGSRPLGEIVARDPNDEAAALRTVYGLLLIGALGGADDVRPSRRARADAVSRDEVQARVGRAIAADHYAVLGVKLECTADEVRDAYYFLARRYHPDRFRAGDLADMLGDIERYFTQVTEAYNTLIDPERRAQYDEEAAARAVGPRKDPQQDSAFLAKQNFFRGQKLAERHQYLDAVRSFENAIQLDPSKAVYHLELGRVLALHPRRRADAEVSLQKALEMDPSLVDGYLALAELYRRVDRAEDALRMVREALRWDPDHEAAAAALQELVPRGRA